MDLFEYDKKNNQLKIDGKTCRTCKHRQRWQCNSKVFQYCGVRKSNRTNNGLLKIKAKDVACLMYDDNEA